MGRDPVPRVHLRAARRPRAPGVRVSRRALLLLGLVGACVDHEPDLWKGTTSLEVDLINPTDGGSMTNRLPDTTRAITIKVIAKDDQGQIDTTVSRDVDLYVQ